MENFKSTIRNSYKELAQSHFNSTMKGLTPEQTHITLQLVRDQFDWEANGFKTVEEFNKAFKVAFKAEVKVANEFAIEHNKKSEKVKKTAEKAEKSEPKKAPKKEEPSDEEKELAELNEKLDTFKTTKTLENFLKKTLEANDKLVLKKRSSGEHAEFLEMEPKKGMEDKTVNDLPIMVVWFKLNDKQKASCRNYNISRFFRIERVA